MNVFIFGGSFDPPHIAHVLAVTYVIATYDADEVLVVPCYRHPLGKELTPFEDRIAMCERAMAWLPRTVVSRVEEQLGGESRTLRTLEHLRQENPDWRMRLVVGADILNEGKRWHAFDRIVELAPLLVLGRVGVETKGAPPPVLPEVSSTAIREAIRSGRMASLVPLVPPPVLSYIETHRLYRGP
jgi:nicotinate-nucleotide adenylyltransferase